MLTKAPNLLTLQTMLDRAREVGCAVGSFAPRYTSLIAPVLRAAQLTKSPLIVQISQNEFGWYQVSAGEFAPKFFEQLRYLGIRVPVTLHLDHTRDFEVIQEAIAAGFTSVMIDASDKPLDENIAITREVVEYAHGRGVSVEAELGRIGKADQENIETEDDTELYTDPREARRFVEETGVDALAVSVGTVHGVYKVKQAKIDFERLQAIRAETDIPLVLHGGSGVPPADIQRAIHLPGGGVTKINIATDLENAFLAALGREKRMLNEECLALPDDVVLPAMNAVEQTVMDKITNFVQSNDFAGKFHL